ncbi:MAG: glycosyl hydrolase [Candidatus Brocadiia bacterium]
MIDPRTFADPGPEFRDVTLWMLNDRLEGDELVRQLEGIRAAGCGAVIARTYNGLRSDYPGEGFMASMETLVAAAGRVGLRVYLQAGFMPACVPDLPEQFCLPVLTARAKGAAADARPLAVCGEVSIHAERAAGRLDLLNPAAVSYYLDLAYERTWRRFKSEFGKTIVSMWVDEPHFNPPHIPWGDGLQAAFERQWGYPLAGAVPSLYGRTGNWELVRYQYWRTVVERLQEAYFAPIAAWCGKNRLAFSGHLMGEDYLESQIGWTGATMPLYPFMDIPGIDHLTRSLEWGCYADAGERGVPFLLTPAQCVSVAAQTRKSAALCEMYGVSSQSLTFRDQKFIGDFFFSKGINVRCLHGTFYSLGGRRKRIYPPTISYQQPWWPEQRMAGDYFARLGYALRQGRRSADVLVLHPVESAFMLFEPLQYIPDGAGPRSNVEIGKLNASLVGVLLSLTESHRSFDLGDEQMLAKMGSVGADGTLRLGAMSYRAVVLPMLLTLRRSTLRLLEQFRRAGGTVLAAGAGPERVEGAPDTAARDFAETLRGEGTRHAWIAALDAALPRRLHIESPGEAANELLLGERELEEGHLVFLCNRNRSRSRRISLHREGARRIRELDPVSGRISIVAGGKNGDAARIKTSMAPGEAKLYLFEDAPVAGGQNAVDSASVEHPADIGESDADEIALDDSWQIQRLGPNALTLDFCRYRTGEGPYSEPLPVIAVQQILCARQYRGPLWTQQVFNVEALPKQAWLAVENPEEQAISLNGKAVESKPEGFFLDRSFQKLDIAALLKSGVNTLELRREFTPLQRESSSLAGLFQNLVGTELESSYIVGEFAVHGKETAGAPGCVRLAPEFRIGVEPSGPASARDLIGRGYPFFAGVMRASRRLTLTRPVAGERLILGVRGLNACLVRVFVNGAMAGVRGWDPFTVDITDAVKEGQNELALELVGTLRNLLGPHHRTAGDPDSCWGEPAFRGDTTSRSGRRDPNWFETRNRAGGPWTDDYLVVPFGFESVSLTRRRTR